MNAAPQEDVTAKLRIVPVFANTVVDRPRGARRSDSDSGVRRTKSKEPRVKLMTPPNAVWVRVWFVGMWWTVALHEITPAGRAIVYLTYGEEQMQVVSTWEYR